MARKESTSVELIYYLCIRFYGAFLWRAARFLHIIFTLFKHLSRKTQVSQHEKWQKMKQMRKQEEDPRANNHSLKQKVCLITSVCTGPEATGHACASAKLSFHLFAISASFLAPKCFCFLWLAHLCCELPTFCWLGFPRDLLWWWDPRPTKWSSLYACRCWDLLEGAFTAGTSKGS